jgi:hypothetical protein
LTIHNRNHRFRDAPLFADAKALPDTILAHLANSD